MSSAARLAFDALMSVRSAGGRLVCDAFWALPDPEAFPSYYVTIQHPVCLAEVASRLGIQAGFGLAAWATRPRRQSAARVSRVSHAELAARPTGGPGSGGGSTSAGLRAPAGVRPRVSPPASAPPRYGLAALRNDLRRLVANTKRFNLPEAGVYQDAVVLERAFVAIERYVTVGARVGRIELAETLARSTLPRRGIGRQPEVHGPTFPSVLRGAGAEGWVRRWSSPAGPGARALRASAATLSVDITSADESDEEGHYARSVRARPAAEAAERELQRQVSLAAAQRRTQAFLRGRRADSPKHMAAAVLRTIERDDGFLCRGVEAPWAWHQRTLGRVSRPAAAHSGCSPAPLPGLAPGSALSPTVQGGSAREGWWRIRANSAAQGPSLAGAGRSGRRGSRGPLPMASPAGDYASRGSPDLGSSGTAAEPSPGSACRVAQGPERGPDGAEYIRLVLAGNALEPPLRAAGRSEDDAGATTASALRALRLQGPLAGVGAARAGLVAAQRGWSAARGAGVRDAPRLAAAGSERPGKRPRSPKRATAAAERQARPQPPRSSAVPTRGKRPCLAPGAPAAASSLLSGGESTGAESSGSESSGAEWLGQSPVPSAVCSPEVSSPVAPASTTEVTTAAEPRGRNARGQQRLLSTTARSGRARAADAVGPDVASATTSDSTDHRAARAARRRATPAEQGIGDSSEHVSSHESDYGTQDSSEPEDSGSDSSEPEDSGSDSDEAGNGGHSPLGAASPALRRRRSRSGRLPHSGTPSSPRPVAGRRSTDRGGRPVSGASSVTRPVPAARARRRGPSADGPSVQLVAPSGTERLGRRQHCAPRCAGRQAGTRSRARLPRRSALRR